MCGICGSFDLGGHQRTDPGVVSAMCDLMRHRGPDGDGFFTAPNVALGMRRLSIIDVAGSDQPLYNEDRSIAMVFNGEIYNYRELRAELAAAGHHLRTDGDGETLIHLYEQHGLDLFAKLRGMYAFALWDANRERLLLAVDHIGMKPLYLHESDGLLHFASEVKALFAAGSVTPALNLDVLDTYLSFGYMVGDETLFAGIRRLPPGHCLVAERGSTRIIRYWDFPDYSPPSPNLPPQAEEVQQQTVLNLNSPPMGAGQGVSGTNGVGTINTARRLIAESVNLHLRSDVPLGLFLSGGVDSAGMLALMAQTARGRIKTFTVGYDAQTPDNELLHARKIAAHFETDHHERVISAADWWQGFEHYVYAHDEPNANPSAVSLLLLSERTAREVKVVLTGLGGDELFGGYGNHHKIPQLIAATTGREFASMLSAPLGWLERHYPAMKRYRVIGALPTYLPRLRHALLTRDDALLRSQMFDGMVFSDALRDRLYSDDLRAAWAQSQHKETVFRAIIARSLRDDPHNTAQALVINTWLTGNALLSQDKTAMAHSLEARVPFFDPVLLRFAADVPPALRMRSNKYVLREALRPLLPAFALERPKRPFGTPILNWFAADLATHIQSVLLDDGAFLRDLFDRPALERLLNAHFAGRESHVEVIFRLLTLEMWARKFNVSIAGVYQR